MHYAAKYLVSSSLKEKTFLKRYGVSICQFILWKPLPKMITDTGTLEQSISRMPRSLSICLLSQNPVKVLLCVSCSKGLLRCITELGDERGNNRSM